MADFRTIHKPHRNTGPLPYDTPVELTFKVLGGILFILFLFGLFYLSFYKENNNIINIYPPQKLTIKEYGLFSGVLHGYLSVFSLISKLYNDSIALYPRNISSNWYWVGYVFGVTLFIQSMGVLIFFFLGRVLHEIKIRIQNLFVNK